MPISHLGTAWAGVARDLELELRRLDPAATVAPRVDAEGLLRLAVTIAPEHRAPARAAIRRHEGRARAMCETCGGRLQTVQAGPVIQFLCVSCRPQS
ncbi:MAG TPA: hypothetical protein VFN87_04610 [Solirubrobacteraceae bacterium]|nr:hypothetical protein [Solirubrobacteraceae bacterium]